MCAADGALSPVLCRFLGRRRGAREVTCGCSASEKRRGTKSRDAGRPLWGFEHDRDGRGSVVASVEALVLGVEASGSLGSVSQVIAAEPGGRLSTPIAGTRTGGEIAGA